MEKDQVIQELGELCDRFLGITMESMIGRVNTTESKKILDRIRQLTTENGEILLKEFQLEIEQLRKSDNKFPFFRLFADDTSMSQGMRVLIAHQILKALS